MERIFLFSYNHTVGVISLMKKAVSIFTLLFLVFSLHASVSLIAKANPQILYDSFPRFDLKAASDSTEYLERGFYTTRQDVYYRYQERDSFFDIGFRIDDDHFRLVFDIDLKETLNSFYRRDYYSNIPYEFDILNDILDLNFPRYAYGELRYDKLYLSIGRRPISWGAGEYQFAISGDVSYLDNIWVDYTTELKNGTFSYNFVLVSFNKLALRYSTYKAGEAETANTNALINPMKTLAAHRVEWNFGFLRFSLGELNLIYNRCPDLLDVTPFGVYHNLYQDGSNVMAFAEAEGLIDTGFLGLMRIYGEIAMDDFSLPTEGEKGKPTAFGVGCGIQWHILDGKDTITLKENSELYRLSSTTNEFRTGLNLTYGIYFCNPYMYNRDIDAGKFTVPLYTDGETSIFEPNALYIGFKYGPNSLYQELKAEYRNRNLEATAGVGILIRGRGYTIDSPYGSVTIGTGDIDYNAVYTLNGERMTTLLLNAEMKYLYAPGLQIEASLEAAFDTYNRKNAVTLTLGHRIDFMSL